MLEKNEMIFGVRAVIEAIQAGREIDKVLVKKDIQSELSKELFTCLKNTLIPVQRVPVERINRITRKNHQGVVAFISSVTYQKTEDLVPFLFEEGKTPLFVMLDGITDVRNFGAIARTCECAAVDAVIIPARGSASVNADAVKTSKGPSLLKSKVYIWELGSPKLEGCHFQSVRVGSPGFSHQPSRIITSLFPSPLMSE